MNIFFAHIFVISILILVPFFNYLETKKIRQSKTAKEAGYWKIHIVYWSITAICILLSSLPNIFYTKHPIVFNTLLNVVIGALIAYTLLTNIAPLIFLKFNRQLREKVAENYDEKLYPVTSRQQIMFVFVSITVGICEEIIFRGFMYNYLQDYFSVSAFLSFILVSVVFGLGHFMQGLSGVISSTIFGLIMGYLYFTTGSLLVPIIIHILYDAKAVFITRVLQKSV